MVQTISNVLTGVATLKIGHSPSGAKAEWSDVIVQTGSHSVKLSKPAIAGSYGSTHWEGVPTGAALNLDIADLEGCAGDWGWSHYRTGIAGNYWEQFEMRFEDPNTTAWVDITIQVDVAAVGAEAWEAETITNATVAAMFGGWSEGAGSFSNYALQAINAMSANIETAENAAGGTISNADDWTLTRVRIELWETNLAHSVYIDDIILNSVTYTIEPGGTAWASMSLSSPSTEVGYTEDGVTMTYTAEETDIDVDEETFSIDRALVKETVEVTCNMAEASLYNMDVAMAGSLLSGSILKLGAGTNKKMELILTGTNPAGFNRQITIPSCTATGSVGSSYQKGEKTIVPVTFSALKTTGNPAVTIVDNAA